MSEERANLLDRREILAAYVEVLQNVEKLLAVCADTTGDRDELRSAICEGFQLSPSAADAVLSLQVVRFAPLQVQVIRDELADVERRLLDQRT